MTAEPCKLFFKSTETFRHVCRQIQNKRLINLLRWAFSRPFALKPLQIQIVPKILIQEECPQRRLEVLGYSFLRC